MSSRAPLVTRVSRRLLVIYRRLFCQQNYIFRHSGPFDAPELPQCTFASHTSDSEIPQSIIDDIIASRPEKSFDVDNDELRNHATLWVALVNGRVGSFFYTRKGSHFRKWFLPLSPDDVVVFRMRTPDQHRGRGYAPALLRHALSQIIIDGAWAHIDCRTYNKPSIKAIEKAGFVRVAKMRTLRPHEVV